MNIKQLFRSINLPTLGVTSALSVGVALTTLANVISVRSTLALHTAPEPQGILMLGGSPNREEFTAEFAKQHDHLEVWVSSGVDRRSATEVFQKAGVDLERVHLDYRAVDTVTNFSTLVEDLKKRDISHVYLITSDFHMSRAKAIASVVLGSQGIVFTPVSIPTEGYPSESGVRIARDVSRAVVWTFTGWAGENLNPRYALRRAIAERDAAPLPEPG
ncbi:YdcF family protein [Capilliphycus salinus ALCB114379]|uniref:YdcF family protein n=1 Tax=Capilliphycus salinus TaxID=2768948 RepID=UPI0039A61B2A